MVEASFRIEERHNVALWRLAVRRSLRQAVLPVGLVIGALLAAMLLVFDARDIGLGAIIGLGLAAGMLAWQSRVALPRRAGTVFNDTVALRDPIAFKGGMAGFQVEQPSGSTHIAWEHIMLRDEDDHALAMHTNALLAYLLPKDQVPTPVIDFTRERLISSGLARKGYRR